MSPEQNSLSCISDCWRLGDKQGGRMSCSTPAPFLKLVVKIKFLPLEESKTFPQGSSMFFLLFQQFHVHPFDWSWAQRLFFYIFLWAQRLFLHGEPPHMIMVGRDAVSFWYIPKFQGSTCALAVSIECPAHPPLQAFSMTINRSSPGSQISGIFSDFFL